MKFTITSIILSSNKIQNGDVMANPEKMPIIMERQEVCVATEMQNDAKYLSI